MLLVMIANIDGAYQAVYDHDDERKAVESLLAGLVADHGFFEDNKIVTEFPSYFEPRPGVFGILAMPDETEDLADFEYMLEGENTFWIYVKPYKPGTIITDRDDR